MAHTGIQMQRRHAGLPCAMVLRLIRARPGETLLLCHHHPRAALDLSRTCHQHRGGRPTRLHRTPCAHTSVARPASTASRPAFLTLRNAPQRVRRTHLTPDLGCASSEITKIETKRQLRVGLHPRGSTGLRVRSAEGPIRTQTPPHTESLLEHLIGAGQRSAADRKLPDRQRRCLESAAERIMLHRLIRSTGDIPARKNFGNVATAILLIRYQVQSAAVWRVLTTMGFRDVSSARQGVSHFRALSKRLFGHRILSGNTRNFTWYRISSSCNEPLRPEHIGRGR